MWVNVVTSIVFSVLFAPVAKFAPTVLPYLERLFTAEEEACSQRSDSAIAAAASITTGVLKAKQASCLPPIENLSISPDTIEKRC